MEIPIKEYEELIRCADAYNSGKIPWCWTKFKKEWISRVFLAWLIVTAFCIVASFLKIKIETNILVLLIIATVIFTLEKPVGAAISNMKINADFKASIQKDIVKDLAKMLESKN